MGTLKKTHRGPARDRRSERGEGGDRPHGRRHLFFALPDSLRARRGPRRASPRYFKHIGLYVYRRDFLLEYSDACRSGPLEQAERLEQLRALENGYRIRVVETEYESLGVDTPEDLERVSLAVSKLSMTGDGA